MGSNLYYLWLWINTLRAGELQKIEDEARARSAVQRPEPEILFTATITDNCILECAHCFEEAGPHKTNYLTARSLEAVADDLTSIFPKYEHRHIRLTGGDTFLHPNLFDIIRLFSSRREQLAYDTLDVETNGWWAVDDATTREMISRLRESGPTIFSASYDYWHRKSATFPIEEHLDRIESIANELGMKFRTINNSYPAEITPNGESIPSVTPIGRARKLPRRYWSHFEYMAAIRPCVLVSRDTNGYPAHEEILIGSDGEVYPCISGKTFKHTTLSLGNIYDSPLADILNNASPLIRVLEEHGLRGLSRLAGLSLYRHWYNYLQFGACGLCHELQREYGARIAPRLMQIET